MGMGDREGMMVNVFGMEDQEEGQCVWNVLRLLMGLKDQAGMKISVFGMEDQEGMRIKVFGMC